MSETIFHIGHQKTGSTYLQNYFFPNLNIEYLGKINDQDKITNNSSFSKNLIKLGNELVFNNIELSQETKNFVKTFFSQTKKKILISKEGLMGDHRVNYFNGISTLNKIKNSFYNPKIIFIFREQVKWLESIYQQSVRDNSFYSPDKFLNFEKKSNYYSFESDTNLHQNVADWYTFIKYNYELFGEKNVLALPFEFFQKDKVNFYLEIMKFLEIEQDLKELLKNIEENEKKNIQTKTHHTILNKRLNHGEVVAKCFINKFYRTARQPFPILSRKLINPESFAKFINFVLIKKNYPYKFPKNTTIKIQNIYKENNKKLEILLKINLKKFGYSC